MALWVAWDAKTIAGHANEIAQSNSQINEIHRLADMSNALQTRFRDSGVDDIPNLADFFFELSKANLEHVVTEDFYKQQINSWCPITRRAHDKLKISWIDNRDFRQVHQSTPWYLEMLDKMVGNSSDMGGGCL